MVDGHFYTEIHFITQIKKKKKPALSISEEMQAIPN